MTAQHFPLACAAFEGIEVPPGCYHEQIAIGTGQSVVGDEIALPHRAVTVDRDQALADDGSLRADPAPFEITEAELSMVWSGAQDNDPAERWLRERILQFMASP